MADLYDYQEDAIRRMHNGCILCGGVGSGKSLTSLGYYIQKVLKRTLREQRLITWQDNSDPHLYIITTARKRDTLEWEGECVKVGIKKENVTVDSWNNIDKYRDKHGFFIFDEQRVVGYGAWAKAFISIARNNKWILLSATPGDCWMDYCAVFIANGFYHNKTDFIRQHVVYDRFAKFPKIKGYINTTKLEVQLDQLLVTMDYVHIIHKDEKHYLVEYDKGWYENVYKSRFNPFTSEPIRDASELCSVLRRCCFSADARKRALNEILQRHGKCIIFYNYNYERDWLKSFIEERGTVYGEWNGHVHMPVPESEKWVYIVQYTAGAEGWNCITCNTIIFLSLNYSFKLMTQAAGRIDRMNTPYDTLNYYYIHTDSTIDKAIMRCLKNKTIFNERMFDRCYTIEAADQLSIPGFTTASSVSSTIL